jgi:two-component system cell cycle response regulator CtrA
MRILLVEDDSATRQTLELMLKSEAFNVYSTDSGEEAVSLGKLYDYDAIVLDLDVGGFDVIRALRLARIKTPIIAMDHHVQVDTIVKVLDLGGDECLAKPFHKDELVARIHALVRRCKGHATNVVQTGELLVNLDSRTVTVRGVPVHFTGKEYQMLELLSLRKGMTLTKEAFLNHIYGGRDEPELKIIDVFICKLRKKLRAAGSDAVETVWGRGYVLRDPDLPVVESASIAAELHDMVDNPPWRVGRGGGLQAHDKAKMAKRIASPPLAPQAGER